METEKDTAKAKEEKWLCLLLLHLSPQSYCLCFFLQALALAREVAQDKVLEKWTVHAKLLPITWLPNVRDILLDGFRAGSDPRRCRIGKGIYFFGRSECARNYADKVNGKILTCLVQTDEVMFDTGEQDFFQASWVAGNTDIALGLHWPAMNNPDKFTELVVRKPQMVTVLFVGQNKAKLPQGSVFRKKHDKAFDKTMKIKTEKLSCGSRIDKL